jgi:hypothetical protein
MNFPTVIELRKLKALGTAAARRALNQAWGIRMAASKVAYRFIPIVDSKTGEHIDNYPVSKEFYEFIERDREAKLARKNETLEQTIARQAAELQASAERSAYKSKQTLWS